MVSFGLATNELNTDGAPEPMLVASIRTPISASPVEGATPPDHQESVISDGCIIVKKKDMFSHFNVS